MNSVKIEEVINKIITPKYIMDKYSKEGIVMKFEILTQTPKKLISSEKISECNDPFIIN